MAREADRAKIEALKKDHLTPQRYLQILDNFEFLQGLWRDRSACVEVCETDPDQFNPNDWFPGEHGKTSDYVPKHVRSVCAECDVRLECLTYAIRTNQERGIWGGKTEKGVKRIRSRLLEALKEMNKAGVLTVPRQAGSKHNA